MYDKPIFFEDQVNEGGKKSPLFESASGTLFPSACLFPGLREASGGRSVDCLFNCLGHRKALDGGGCGEWFSRIHQAFGWSEFQKALIPTMQNLTDVHSFSWLVEPANYDPNMPHFHFGSYESVKTFQEADWRQRLTKIPLLNFFRTNPFTRCVGLDTFWPEENEESLRQLDFYQTTMVPEGWRHAFGMVFRSEYHQIKHLLILRRDRKMGDFSRDERWFFENILHPNLEAALRRIESWEWESSRRHALQSLLLDSENPVIILDWEIKSLFVNQTGIDYCSLCNFGESEGKILNSVKAFKIPREIKAACLAIRQGWENGDFEKVKSEPFCRVTITSPSLKGMFIVVKSFRPKKPINGKPFFQISFESQSGDPGFGQELMNVNNSQLFGLSVTERQVIHLVLSGLSNQEISTQLGKSVDTVKKHMGAIYKKTGISGRGRLMACLKNGG